MNEFLQSPHLLRLSQLDHQHFTTEEMYRIGYQCPGPELTCATLSPSAGLHLPLRVCRVCEPHFFKTTSAPQVMAEHWHSLLRSLRRSMKYSLGQSTMSISLSSCWQHWFTPPTWHILVLIFYLCNAFASQNKAVHSWANSSAPRSSTDMSSLLLLTASTPGRTLHPAQGCRTPVACRAQG